MLGPVVISLPVLQSSYGLGGDLSHVLVSWGQGPDLSLKFAVDRICLGLCVVGYAKTRLWLNVSEVTGMFSSRSIMSEYGS